MNLTAAAMPAAAANQVAGLIPGASRDTMQDFRRGLQLGRGEKKFGRGK